jgi:hypothetical protein
VLWLSISHDLNLGLTKLELEIEAKQEEHAQVMRRLIKAEVDTYLKGTGVAA